MIGSTRYWSAVWLLPWMKTSAGMPAWGKVLGPQKVAAVTAFVVSKSQGQGG